MMTSEAFPLKLLGLVHVSQRLERRRAIGAGEVLSARVSVEGHRIVRRGAELELHTEVCAGGAAVWKGVSVILSQAVAGDGVKRVPPQEPTFAIERSETWALPAGLGRRYAKVSHDYNPIHLSALSAKLFGFPRALVHGWWSLARCLAALDDALAPACVVEASFRKPIFLPSTVSFEAGRGAEGLHFRLRRADGELALTGRCRAIPP
jgi:acyl dehydratase